MVIWQTAGICRARRKSRLADSEIHSRHRRALPILRSWAAATPVSRKSREAERRALNGSTRSDAPDLCAMSSNPTSVGHQN
jgi:hypothetical protein